MNNFDFSQLFSDISLSTAIADCYNGGKYKIHRNVREEVPKENRKMQCFLQTRSNAQGHCQVSGDTWEGKGGRIAW